MPIPGTNRSTNLHDNVAAAEVTLSEDEMAEIETGLLARPVTGERYTAEGMKGVNV